MFLTCIDKYQDRAEQDRTNLKVHRHNIWEREHVLEWSSPKLVQAYGLTATKEKI